MHSLASGKNTRAFFQKEIQQFMDSNTCANLDRDGIKNLLTVCFVGALSR